MHLKNFRIYLSITILLVLVMACNETNRNFSNTSQGIFTRTVDDVSYEAFSTITEQAEFATIQSSIMLDELGVYDLDLPPVAPGSMAAQAGSSNDEMLWHNPHDYYRNLPEGLKSQITNAVERVFQENPELRKIESMGLAEFSQLVPQSTKDKVQEDVLGLFTIAGSTSDKPLDWVATIVIKFDDFTIRKMSINPVLTNIEASNLDAEKSPTEYFVPATMLLEPEQERPLLATRRIIADEIYEEIISDNSVIDVTSFDVASFQSLNGGANILSPDNLSILAIYTNGEVKEVDLTHGLTTKVMEKCGEACRHYLTAISS